MTQEQIRDWYKKWCNDTKRGGSVLIGSSIQELLMAFYNSQTQQP
jgi:hypothetical protein